MTVDTACMSDAVIKAASSKVDEIADALRIFHADGELIEIRGFIDGAGWLKNASGYFTDAHEAAKGLEQFIKDNRPALSKGSAQWYFVLNNINSACYSRTQHDKIIANPKGTTGDGDVLRYQWLFVDFDPVRPAGTSASDAELAEAAKRSDEVRNYLYTLGFNEPITAGSGNGYHLHYRIDEPATEDTKALIKGCLSTLAEKFSDDAVDVDAVNFNAARLCKLYGTTARKGANTPERPHRKSHIISTPETIVVNSHNLLVKLAGEQKPQSAPTQRKYSINRAEKFNLVDFMHRNGIGYKELRSTGRDNSTIYSLDACPFDSNHKDGDSKIFSYPDGAISFMCHHNGCSGKTWQDVRLLFEPDAYDRKYDCYDEGWNSKRVDDNKNPFVLEIRDNLSALIKPAAQYSKKSVDWIIPQWIPKGVICVVYGDGGNGKSYTVLDIVSKLSKGRATMLDTAAVTDRKPMTILYANHEDDIEAVTMSRLERAGADMQNIHIPNLDADTDNRIDGLRLTSEALRQAVETLKPDIVVLDPLQSFIPAETNMGARNQMRACFSPLEHMAHTYGTTFIVVCHTNKRGDAFGRNKISDSSDIWDIARAVMAVGKTKDKVTKYISLEKSNYQSHPETVLFSITDAGVQVEGRTDKHESDFVLEMPAPSGRPSDKRDDCKDALLDALTDAPSGLTSSYLTDWLMEQGFSEKTISRAKSDLYKNGLIMQERSRFGGSVMIKPTLPL